MSRFVSTRVEIPGKPTIDLVVDLSSPTTREQRVGKLVARLYPMGPIWCAEIENRGHTAWSSTPDWVQLSRWAAGMPEDWWPIYFPLDHSSPVIDLEGRTIAEIPSTNGVPSVPLVADGHWAFGILTPAHDKPKHYAGGTNQPQGVHTLEGRQCLRFFFGPPGHDLGPATTGLQKLDIFLGGGIGGGGHEHVERVVREWRANAGSFSAAQRPWTAGTAFLATHEIYPWANWRPARGVRWLGITPSPDGTRAGSNSRYWTPMWLMAAGDAGGMLLALSMLRSISGSGTVLDGDDDAYDMGWQTGLRRSEKSNLDFVGDSSWPAEPHNFTEDVQLGAAVFPQDPIIVRAAEVMRRKLLGKLDVWDPKADSRIIDRWLSGLRAAYILTVDPKYADHAAAVLAKALADRPSDEPFFRNTSSGAGRHFEIPWFDAGICWRICEWLDTYPEKFQPFVPFLMRCASWLGGLVRADGAMPYSVAIDVPPNASVVVTYPDWWRKIAVWYFPLFWSMAQKTGEERWRKLAAKVCKPWLETFTEGTEFWEGNATEKTRGQEMLGCLLNGQIIRDCIAWGA